MKKQALKKGFDFKSGRPANFYPERYFTRDGLDRMGWRPTDIKKHLTPTVFTQYRSIKRYWYIRSQVFQVLRENPELRAKVEQREEELTLEQEAIEREREREREHVIAEKEDAFVADRLNVQMVVYAALRIYAGASAWPPNGFESFDAFAERVQKRLRADEVYVPMPTLREILSQKVAFEFSGDPDYEDLYDDQEDYE